MLRQATRRKAASIQAGRVTLTLGTVEQLPPALDGPFDAILAVNSVGFWSDPTERLEELRRRLRSGGRIAVASQPRCPGATRSTSLEPPARSPTCSRPQGSHRPNPKSLTSTLPLS